MDTTVVFRYLKSAAKINFSLVALLLLLSCPGDDMDCNDFGSIAEVPNLILLTPEQTTYNVGDEITLKLNIPAVNDYYGTESNLFALTGDESALLVLGFQDLFEGNLLNYIKGSQSDFPNWFNMPFDPVFSEYQLEVNIVLSAARQYSSSPLGTVTVQGGDFCDRYFIDTNIQWTITNGRLEFTVNE